MTRTAVALFGLWGFVAVALGLADLGVPGWWSAAGGLLVAALVAWLTAQHFRIRAATNRDRKQHAP